MPDTSIQIPSITTFPGFSYVESCSFPCKVVTLPTTESYLIRFSNHSDLLRSWALMNLNGLMLIEMDLGAPNYSLLITFQGKTSYFTISLYYKVAF